MDPFEENKIILHSYLDNVIGKVEFVDEDAESCEKYTLPRHDIGTKNLKKIHFILC